MTIATSPNLDGLLLQVLATPEGQADPYPDYARMRDEAGVSRTAFGPYVVNGYEECLGVLRDPCLGRGIGTRGHLDGDLQRRRHPPRRIPRGVPAQHAAVGPARSHPAAPPGLAVFSPPGRWSGSVPRSTVWSGGCSTSSAKGARPTSWLPSRLPC